MDIKDTIQTIVDKQNFNLCDKNEYDDFVESFMKLSRYEQTEYIKTIISATDINLLEKKNYAKFFKIKDINSILFEIVNIT